jgi:AmmeMemoRadiSam system protein A
MTTDVFGIIAPHPPIIVEAVGGSRAKVTGDSLDALSRAAAALEAWGPETVVVMSPHSPTYSDAFVIETAPRLSGSFEQFGAPQARYEYRTDVDFARALLQLLAEKGVPAVDRALEPRLSSGTLDHGVMVPLSFLDPSGRWPVVVLSLSYLPYESHREMGEAVAEVARQLGRRTAFVASGDCSHRLTRDAPAGYSPRAADLDAAIVEHVREGDLAGLADIDPEIVEAGGECGLRSFIALGGFAGTGVPAHVLAYEGPWGVGYLTALVGGAALSAGGISSSANSERNVDAVIPVTPSPTPTSSEIVSLARRTIEAYVREGRPLASPALHDPALPERAGVFVSLHRGGELRGCIGTILPTQATLAEEVVHNAIQASTQDPRFPPVTVDDLAELDVKVDVLHQPEGCSVDDLDPKRYGVIVTSGWRRGLLLPDLEGVDDVEAQVAIAMRKAGIAPGERCGFERFKVDRYE